MRSDHSNEVWVSSRTSLFPDDPPVQGDGNDAPSVTGNPPVAPSTPPQQQGTNWEAAYKTLQRNHTALQQQVEALTGQNNSLTAQLATRAKEHGDLQAQLQAQTAQATELSTQVDALTGERDTLNSTLARQKLIMGEFPQLARLEAEGLLPQAEGEETMRDVFTKFATTIEGIQQSAIQNLMDGASPEPVPGQGDGDGKPVTLTSDQLWDKVVELSRNPSQSSEYERTYEEYLEALKGEGKEVSGNME